MIKKKDFKMNKKILLTITVDAVVLAGLITLGALLGGCSKSNRVSYNLAQEADNFNVYRRVTVVNCITGDTMMTLEGYASITADTEDNQLEIIVEYEEGKYMKSIIGLSNNVSYLVEDLTTTDTDGYHYEVNFNPDMWIPFEPTIID